MVCRVESGRQRSVDVQLGQECEMLVPNGRHMGGEGNNGRNSQEIDPRVRDVSGWNVSVYLFVHRRMIAAASFDSNISVYRLENGEWTFFTMLEGHVNEVKSICWSHDSQLLASSSRWGCHDEVIARDRNVIVWGYNKEDDEMDCVSVLSGHTQDVKFVRFCPTTNNLYSCSYDDTIKIWLYDGDDFSNINTLRGHEGTVWGLSFKNVDNPVLPEAMEEEKVEEQHVEGIGLDDEDVMEGIALPDGTYKETEFVSCGMDGRVIYWKERDGAHEFRR